MCAQSQCASSHPIEVHLLAAVHARPPRMDPQSSSPSSSSPLDAVGAGNN
jgi:hypothetical protein